MVSMATYDRLKNGGVPTTLLIAQLLLIIDCLTSYHIKLRHRTLYLFVAYANYLIWIFINISKTLKKMIQ